MALNEQGGLVHVLLGKSESISLAHVSGSDRPTSVNSDVDVTVLLFRVNEFGYV